MVCFTEAKCEALKQVLGGVSVPVDHYLGIIACVGATKWFDAFNEHFMSNSLKNFTYFTDSAVPKCKGTWIA